MNRMFVAAAVAVSLIGTAATAEAASRKIDKRYYQQPHAHMVWNAPVATRRVGPAWAMPNECYTDEGYGRYQACDAGMR